MSRASPFSFPFGPFAALPNTLIRLPFDLLRSQLYPGSPDIVGKAVMEGAADQPQPNYLPQKFGFRRWKDDGNQAWDSTVSSPIRAFQNSSAAKYTSNATRAPISFQQITQKAQDMGGQRLPQPSDNLSSFATPIAEGVNPKQLDRIPPEMLDAAVNEARKIASDNANASLTKRQDAVMSARDALARLVGEAFK